MTLAGMAVTVASGYHQGIDALTQELIATAPEYFNLDTGRGRAAILAAQLIAGGEITGVLPRVSRNRSLLYNYMGGSGGKMRGWAQFNTYYFNPWSRNRNSRMSFDAVSYNRKVGRILYGIDPKPTGRGYFNIDRFVRFLERERRGYRDEVRAYLVRHFSIADWHGLHEPGGGASRIRGLGIEDFGVLMVYGGGSYPRYVASAPSVPPPVLPRLRGEWSEAAPNGVLAFEDGGVTPGVRVRGGEGLPLVYALYQERELRGYVWVDRRSYRIRFMPAGEFPLFWEDLWRLNRGELATYWLSAPGQPPIPLNWIVTTGGEGWN